MNYAALYKARLLDGTFEEVADYVNRAVKRQRFRGMEEIIFYYSSTNVQQFYSCSLWLRLEDLEAAKTVPLDSLLPPSKLKSVMVEEDVFRLLWERQYLTTPVEVSTIRPMTFPADYSEERSLRFARNFRQFIQGIKGLRGVWIGRSLYNCQRLLIRVDWASLEDWQELANKEFHKRMLNFYTKNNIITEFGSSKWADNLQYEYSRLQL